MGFSTKSSPGKIEPGSVPLKSADSSVSEGLKKLPLDKGVNLSLGSLKTTHPSYFQPFESTGSFYPALPSRV